MTCNQRNFLLDIQGFISFALANPRTISFDLSLMTLYRDISSTWKRERCFTPETKGFKKHLIKE